MAIFSNSGFYGFLTSCLREAGTYKEWFQSGTFKEGRGWRIGIKKESEAAKSYLETDRIQVRNGFRSVDCISEAEAEEGNARPADPEDSVAALKPQGFLLETHLINENGQSITGYSRAEFDEIYVRKRAVFREYIIEELCSMAGGLIISAAHAQVSAVLENGRSIYVALDNEASGSTDFLRGDMVLSERAYRDADTGQFGIKRYWKLVEAVGLTQSLPADSQYEVLKKAGKRYLMLSQVFCEKGGGQPETGDSLVQFGHIALMSELKSESDAAALVDRQRALVLSSLDAHRACFTEYTGLGATNLSPQLAEEGWFRLDPDVHELTRIGGGNNKFTGDFVITSEGSGQEEPGLGFSEYTKKMQDFEESISELQHLSTEEFLSKVTDETDRASMVADLYGLKELLTEVREIVFAFFSEQGQSPLFDPIKEGGGYVEYNEEQRLMEEKVQDMKREMHVQYDMYEVSVGLLMEALQQWEAVLNVPAASINLSVVTSRYQNFQQAYARYLYEYELLSQLIESFNNLMVSQFTSEIEVSRELIRTRVSETQAQGSLLESELKLNSTEINGKVSVQYQEYNGPRLREAGFTIGAKDGTSWIEMQADKISIGRKNHTEGDPGTFQELIDGKAITKVKSQYKEAGLELGVNGTKSIARLYADQIYFKDRKNSLFPLAQLREDQLKLTVQNEYGEAGLIVDKTQNTLKLVAGQIDIQNQKDGQWVTNSLFENGWLNSRLIQTDQLVIRGSLAERMKPLILEKEEDVYLNFENGFNFSGYIPYEANGRNLVLPVTKEYSGMRSTIVNNSDPGYVYVRLGTDENNQCTGSFETSRDLTRIVWTKTPINKVKVTCIMLKRDGIVRLFSYWKEATGDTEGELCWFIENIGDFSIYSVTPSELQTGDDPQKMDYELALANFQSNLKLIPTSPALNNSHFQYNSNLSIDYGSYKEYSYTLKPGLVPPYTYYYIQVDCEGACYARVRNETNQQTDEKGSATFSFLLYSYTNEFPSRFSFRINCHVYGF